METNRHIFSTFSSQEWDQGLKWVRATKQAGVTLSVVDTGLQEEQADKLRGLGVNVMPLVKKIDVQQVDIFNTIVPTMGGGIYLFWDILIEPEETSQFWSTKRLAAIKSMTLNIPSLVFPLANIDSRVRFGARIESDLVRRFDGVLSSGLMAGTAEGWKIFTGLYNHLMETGLLEPNVFGRNLALNLMAIYFEDWVEAKAVPYQISTLQPKDAG